MDGNRKIWIDEMSGSEKRKKRKIERMSWKKGQQRRKETEEITRDEMKTMWGSVKRLDWWDGGEREEQRSYSLLLPREKWSNPVL